MTNPPRRSRPRKPAETIDLTAERIDGEPPQPQTDDAPGKGPDAVDLADPEARLAEAASPAPGTEEPKDAFAPSDPGRSDAPAQPEGLAVLGEAEPGDRNAPPAGNGTVTPQSPADETVLAGGGAPKEGETPMAETTEERFAAEESLRRDRLDDEAHEELDAETILAAAEPHPAEPPRPQLDYHATSSQPVAAGGPGFGPLLGAGLTGAVLALLLGGLLQYAGVLPGVRAPDTTQLAQQFARNGDVQQLGNDLNAVRNDVGQLKSTLSAGGVAGTGPSGADFAALADRVNGLDGRLNGLAEGNNQPAIDPSVLNGVTQAANEARDASTQARDAAAQATNTANEARQTADAAGGRADEARQTATTAQQAAGTAQQAAELAQRAAAGATEASDANRQAIAEIQSRIGSVEDANRQAAVAISAANLKAAVDRGGPFMSELESYAKSAGGSPAVDALRNYAASGVPTTASLQASWPDVRGSILKALRPQDPNAGVGEQILSGLSGLVAVRPSGSAASATGSGPEATVARLDAALQNGDLAGWKSQWDTLPQAAKDASTDFQKQVDARAEAERVVGGALGQAVNSIGNAG